MAKRRRKSAKPVAPKPVSRAHKRRFMLHLLAAEAGLKTLSASVKSLRSAAEDTSFVGAAPVAAKRRRRKRG